jgi:hypothetical protein
MSQERIDAALSGSAPILPRVPVVDPTDTSRPTGPAGGDVLGMSAEQTAQMARALENAGMPIERIQAAMAADGFKEAPEVNSPAQVEHNKSFGMANLPKASDYRINLADAGVRGMDVTEAGQFIGEAQGFLEKTGMPAAMGSALVTQAIRDTENLKAMTSAQRTLWSQEQKVLAQRSAGGADGLQQRVAAAAAVLRMVGPSAFRDRLVQSGALNSAYAISTLASWSGHVSRWQASKPPGSKS